MVYIVGIGPGSKEYILPKAIDILKKSKYIVGFSRGIYSLENMEDIAGDRIVVKSLKEIIDFIKSMKSNENISIIASGDPTFYGVGEYIKNNFTGTLEIIPGISSFQYLTCKLGKSWSKAYTGSLHGREDDFINKIKEYDTSIWLTDNINNPSKLCKKIVESEVNCNVIIGENLSYEDEVITIDKPHNLINLNCSDLSIFIVDRDMNKK